MCCVRKFFHLYLLVSKLLVGINFILFSSCMFRVQNKSPIRVLSAEMFSMPSTTFELPFDAAELANLCLSFHMPFANLIHSFIHVGLVFDFYSLDRFGWTG